jgi:hypothetical protein
MVKLYWSKVFVLFFLRGCSRFNDPFVLYRESKGKTPQMYSDAFLNAF